MLAGPFDLNNVALLRVGRHFRLAAQAKLIVGRDEKDNQRLMNLAREGDIIFEPVSLPGPTALGRGVFSDELRELSLKIVARYTAPDQKVEVRVACGGREIVENAAAITENELTTLRI